MQLSGINQLAVAVKESFSTLTTDNYPAAEEKVSPVQHTYIDSVEFSDRAIALSMGKDTDTDSRKTPATGQRQEEDPDTNLQQEPVFRGAALLNVLA